MKSLNKNDIFKYLAVLVIGLLISYFVYYSPFAKNQPSEAQGTSNPLIGWAWSNVGWISLNCKTTPTDTCTTYGVNETNGTLSGYAWSDQIGWINFGLTSNEVLNCPTSPCKVAEVDTVTGAFSGWVRACGVFQNGCSGALHNNLQLGGWDGWISLSGNNPAYGVTRNIGTGAVTGYAWGGSEMLGWLEFKGQLGAGSQQCPPGYNLSGGICVQNNCVVNCSTPPSGCPTCPSLTLGTSGQAVVQPNSQFGQANITLSWSGSNLTPNSQCTLGDGGGLQGITSWPTHSISTNSNGSTNGTFTATISIPNPTIHPTGPSGTFSLTCGGTATAQTGVSIPTPNISLSYTCTPNSNISTSGANIIWQETNAQNCLVTGPGGSLPSSPASVNTPGTYTLVCENYTKYTDTTSTYRRQINLPATCPASGTGGDTTPVFEEI